jgi:ribosomal protein S27AE
VDEVSLSIEPVQSLPKAQHCVMEVSSQGTNPSLDLRSVLESELRRRFTTITKDLVIPVEAVGMRFRVVSILVDGAEVDGGVIVDTELSVEIRHVTAPVLTGSDDPIKIATDMDVQVKLARSSRKEFRVDVRLVEKLRISLDVKLGDVNMYASNTTASPDQQMCEWFNVDVAKHRDFVFDFKSLPRPENAVTDEGVVYLAVVGYAETSEVAIKFHINTTTELKTGTPADTYGKILCDNCRSYIPEMSIERHKVFCERNNQFCNSCQRVILRAEWSKHWHCSQCEYWSDDPQAETKHYTFMHTLMTCSCSIQLFWDDYHLHRRNECPNRLIQCRYCRTVVVSGSNSRLPEDLIHISTTPLTEHESECGSRTIECRLCHRSVIIKQVQTHMRLQHDRERQAQQLPFHCCLNEMCARAIDPKNDMKLCIMCFSPFWMSIHDPSPTGPRDEGPRKRYEKLIRKYFDQITTGCGRSSCLNPYCKSSAKLNESVKEIDGPNQAALLALELAAQCSLKVAGVVQADGPSRYFLCMTDTRSEERRHLANEKLVPLGYALEWCLTALEKSKSTGVSNNDDDSDDDEPDVARVRQEWIQRAVSWLVNHVSPTST